MTPDKLTWQDAAEATKELLDSVTRERDGLRAENERLQRTIKDIELALAHYERDRMWAYAIRRIRRIIERLAIPA